MKTYKHLWQYIFLYGNPIEVLNLLFVELTLTTYIFPKDVHDTKPGFF